MINAYKASYYETQGFFNQTYYDLWAEELKRPIEPNYVLINPGNDATKLKTKLTQLNITAFESIYITNPYTTGALDDLLKEKNIDRAYIVASKYYKSASLTALQNDYRNVQISDFIVGSKAHGSMMLQGVVDTQEGYLSYKIPNNDISPVILILSNVNDRTFKEVLISNSNNILQSMQTILVDAQTTKQQLATSNLFYNENQKTGNVSNVYLHTTADKNYVIDIKQSANVQMMVDDLIIFT